MTDLVARATEWPTSDYSIKTLARYAGFEWRDADPSGASSIEWYARWLETRDPAIKQRILQYNEDDCHAMRVLLDRIRDLQAQNDRCAIFARDAMIRPIHRRGDLSLGHRCA
jgi:predicted RecB family nuclease